VSFEDFQFNLELIDGTLFLEGEKIDVEIKPYLTSVESRSESHRATNAIIKAPIPGKILQILVTEQELVEKEQLILIIEAMKMKNRILSPIKSKVIQIFVVEEEHVAQDQQLVKIKS